MSFHAPVLKPTNEKESDVTDFPDFSFLFLQEFLKIDEKCSLWLSFHWLVLDLANENLRTPVEHSEKYECTPVGHSEKDECSRPAGPCSRGKSLAARRMARPAHAADRSTAGRRARQRLRWWHGRSSPLEVGRPLLCPIPILLRALAILLVLRRVLNLWLKITPRLQQGPTEVLRNLVREIVVAPNFFANDLSLMARCFTTRSRVESSQLQ